MEELPEKFNTSVSEVRLDGEASSRIRRALIGHMRAYPILASPYEKYFGILSPYLSLIEKPHVLAPILFLMIFAGASTYAAGGALPSDALYPLKVGVVEPVKGLFAISSQAKANWKVSLAETRLTEVEQLAVKNELTSEEGTRGQERFDTSYNDAQDTIQRLSEEDPEAAQMLDSSFSAALDKHEKILSSIASASPAEGASEADSFASHIRSHLSAKAAKTAAFPTLLMSASTSEATSTSATSTPTTTDPRVKGVKIQVDREESD